MFKIFLILVSFLFISCAPSKESPVVYFSNASADPISDIKCDWVGKHTMTLAALNPGDSRSQSFYIRDNDDFFGRIKVSWRNNKGAALVREFAFRKNNLPSIFNSKTYNYVQFYLDQDELEIISSDAPNLSGKIRKMDKLMRNHKKAYLRKGKKNDNSLISLEDLGDPDKAAPYWLVGP